MELLEIDADAANSGYNLAAQRDTDRKTATAKALGDGSWGSIKVSAADGPGIQYRPSSWPGPALPKVVASAVRCHGAAL